MTSRKLTLAQWDIAYKEARELASESDREGEEKRALGLEGQARHARTRAKLWRAVAASIERVMMREGNEGT